MVEAEAKPAQERRGGRRTAVRVILLSLAVAIVVVELGLRFIIPGKIEKMRPQLAQEMAKARTTGHPFLSFYGKPNFRTPPENPLQKSHDRYGLRGNAHPIAKPDDVYRIVCLGGSSTYGHTPTSDEKTWPARLEHWLNDLAQKNDKPYRVQVINGGMSGYSTFESTSNLSFRLLEWKPDLVLVYHTINDMRCALYDRAGPIQIDNTHWRAIWPRVFDSPPGERVLESSVTYLALRKSFSSYVQGIDELARYNIVAYDKDDGDPYLHEGIPSTGFDNFERNLRCIQAIAKEFGADVIFASQACDEADIVAPSGPHQLAGMARMTEILRRLAEEKDLVFVDAKTKLEDIASKEGRDKVFTGEVHLTDYGAERLSLIFTEAIWLGGHGLLPD